MMEVIWEKDNLPHRETMAIWDEHPYYVVVNPGRIPTAEELEACPKYLPASPAWRNIRKRNSAGDTTKSGSAFTAYPISMIGQQGRWSGGKRKGEEALRETAEELSAAHTGRAGRTNWARSPLVFSEWISDTDGRDRRRFGQ